MLCGIGGGKTWCGVHWILKQITEFPNATGFIGANTYSQLRNSTLSAVFNEFTRLGITFKYNSSLGHLHCFNTKIICKSMENYDVIRGIEIGWYWLDEAAYTDPEAFNVLVGRLRDKKGPLKGLITSSPSGYNYLYEYFDNRGDKHTSDFNLIHATSYANKYLPDGYIDSLKSQYSQKFFKQEILGEFINIQSDTVYYAFDDQLSVIDSYQVNPREPICITYDFNIGVGKPMSLAIFQYINDIFYFFEEVIIEGMRTEDTIDELEAKNIFEKSNKYIVHGDASGNSRTTNHNRTDYDIIRKRLSNLDIVFEIDVPNANPPVRKRHIVVNGQLKDANDNTHVKITKNCKTIIKGLKQTKLRDSANYVEDDSDAFQHVTTAIGYGIIKQMDRKKTPSRFGVSRI